MLSDAGGNSGFGHGTLKARQNLVHLAMFPFRACGAVPCKDVSNFTNHASLCSLSRLMSYVVKCIAIGSRRNNDRLTLDAVTIEVQVQCNVCFSGIDARFVNLVNDFLSKRDAIEGSQIEEADYSLDRRVWNRLYSCGLNPSLAIHSMIECPPRQIEIY